MFAVFINVILTTLIVAIIAYRFGFRRGYKSCEDSNLSNSFKRGFHEGKQLVHHEISELLKLKDDEILERIKTYKQ